MSEHGAGLEGTGRSATGASREVLENLVRKKWIARQDASAARDARRTVQIAVLREAAGKLDDKINAKLNDNQRKIISFLQQNQGRAAVASIRELEEPRTHLQTLITAGTVVRIEQGRG